MRLFVGAGVLAGLLAFSGCRNTALVYDDAVGPLLGSRAAGRYVVESARVRRMGELPTDLRSTDLGMNKGRRTDGEILADWLAAESPDVKVFRPDPERDSIPVKLEVEVSNENTRGIAGTLNNALSICTLNVWPMFTATTSRYRISAQFPGDKQKVVEYSFEERALSSWFLLGLVPVPAWADRRDVRSGQMELPLVHDAVLSILKGEDK